MAAQSKGCAVLVYHLLYNAKYLTNGAPRRYASTPMPDPRPCRRAPRRPFSPSEIVPDALDHLAVIRQTMERSTAFTAVSGWGYCAMGATAFVAAAIAMRQPTTEAWLAVWLAEALTAVTLGLVAMHWKATKLGTHLMSVSGRRLFIGLLPAPVA